MDAILGMEDWADSRQVTTAAEEVWGGRSAERSNAVQGSGSWTPMTNAFGAAYQISNFGSPPFSLRITGQGQTLVAR